MGIFPANLLSVAMTGFSGHQSNLSGCFRKLTRGSTWELISEVPLKFPSGHPQGMVKIGESFYISSVEITKPTVRYPEPRGGYDRDTGEGAGFFCKIDGRGNLLEKISIGEGPIYHPGGIDFDGSHIWVPAAEYRPDSRSIIYRIGTSPLRAEKMFEYGDHIGGIVHNTDANTLHGISWGARRFYTWPLDAGGKVRGTDIPREKLMIINPGFYIDYQDCHYLGNHEMLCSGVSYYKQDGEVFGLGGIELVDLKTNLPVHQIPVELWSPKTKRPMTNNPFWMEEMGGMITAYFIPDDDDSVLYTYRVTP